MKTQYKIQGSPNSPVLILSHSLGCDMHLWDKCVTHFLPYFRVLQYDIYGHGLSDVPPDPCSIDLLGHQVIQLMDDLEIQHTHFCGISMGGLIGQWLGIHHPDRMDKLVIGNTAARIGSPERWDKRIAQIQTSGMKSIAKDLIDTWFSKDFHRHSNETVQEFEDRIISNNPTGYTHCCSAIRNADFSSKLQEIKNHTLVIAGNDDPVTTRADAEFLVGQITTSQLKALKGHHLLCREHPNDFAELVIDFLVGSSAHERGMHIRRTVLGNEYVENRNSRINSFNRDFQTYISNYAWGEIWSRPELPNRIRSLLTLSMLVALNRLPEFKMHVKAALNNGVSVEEIREVLLHSTIYCGSPAANESFHAAEEVFRELGMKL